MNQYDLEHWWVEQFRANGAASAQRLREAGRVSSDPILRSIINTATKRVLDRAVSELFSVPVGHTRSHASTILLKLTESMETLALSHIVVCAGLNYLLDQTRPNKTLASTGKALGDAVRTELRIRFIEKVYPKIYRHWSKAGGTFVHKNRALMAVSGRASDSGLPGFLGDKSVRHKVDMALVEMMLLAADVFEPYQASRGRQKIWCVRVKQSVVTLFNRSVNLDELLTIVPPLGLYIEPLPADRTFDPFPIKRRPIVVTPWLKGRKPSQPSELIISGLDSLNRVGYRVNVDMLSWIESHASALAGRGVVPNFELKFRESDDRADVYRQWFKREPSRRLYTRTMMLARHLVNNTFYHDWFVDFRGRMYTTSPLLSPQGTSLSKSLILFAETATVPLGGAGAAYGEFMLYGWRMAIGKKRVDSFDPMYIWDLVEVAVRGDLDTSHLDDAKDYLPFVAWALEAQRLRRTGSIETGIPIRRDATASSIQHMATMAQDRELMKLVNLTDTPAGDISDLYSNLNPGHGIRLSRASLKSFVMTYCYNSTAYGRAQERLKRGEDGTLKSFMLEDSSVRDSIEPVLVGVSTVRDALGAIGESSAWKFTSPSGMVWDGARYEWPSREVRVRYNQAVLRVRLQAKGNEVGINIRKTRSSYVANVIHSLDAAMLQLAHPNWPSSVAFIHDCVVTLPGRMDDTCLALRTAFFMMHKNIRANYSNWGIEQTDVLCYNDFINNSLNMFI